MASSFLGKSPNSFPSIAVHHLHHHQSAHNQQCVDMEYEKASSPSSSSALNSDDLLAGSNEAAAMALSSLLELGKNCQKQYAHQEQNDNDDCRVDAPTVASSPSYAVGATPATLPTTFTTTATPSAAFSLHAPNGAGKSEDNESGDELPPQDDCASDAPVHEIRCGLLNARLHMQRFTCPGIHRKCVEFEGKLISPRQFTIKAEKDKQKDWKGSIRLGKHNLRTLMEMKRIDFYEHASNCSLKCQSRNYIKNRKTDGAGAGTESAMALDTMDDGKPSNSGALDFGDANEAYSTTSSSSTRKSSAVLEDYVSQTIPNVNGPFVALNLGTLCMNNGEEQHPNAVMCSRSGQMMGNDCEEKHQQSPLVGQNASSHLFGISQSVLPTTSSSSLPVPPPFCTPSNSATTASCTASAIGVSASMPQSVAQTSLSFVPSFGLLQHSPLKQLFAASQNRQQQQPQLSTASMSSASSIGLLPTQQNGGGMKTTTTAAIGGGQSAVGVLPAELNNNNQLENSGGNGTSNTLTLLLQSLQTSILLEHQQKATLSSSNNNSIGNNLAAFLNRIPSLNGGGAAPIEAAALQHRNGQMSAEQSLTGANRLQQQQQLTGIERLLNATALLPQLHPFQQHQRTQTTTATTTPKQEGSGGGGGNVRKVMEENAVLFWSQMRSMGLLDDFLNTLSTTLERLKNIYLNGGNAVSEEFAARRLSGVALALDLCTLFGDKIHNRCIQATLETNLITKELLELQRKQEEQKRKLESAKRKSQLFELLKNGNDNREGGSADSPPDMKKIHLNI